MRWSAATSTSRRKPWPVFARSAKAIWRRHWSNSRAKKAFINENIEQLRANILALVEDTTQISDSALIGKLDTRPDVARHQGDFRRIIQGINGSLDAIIEPITEAMDVLSAMSNGDLTRSITGDYQGKFLELKTSVNGTVEKLSEIIGEVRGSADSLSSASEEISATAQSMSQSASEQAASVEQTSASMEQMSASIAQNTENAKVTDGMAGKANKEASEGGRAVKDTVAAMKTIAEKNRHRRLYRLPDQSAGAQCRDRSRAGR